MATPREANDRRGAVGALLDAGTAATVYSPTQFDRQRPSSKPTYRKRQIILDHRTDTTLQELTDSLRRVTGTRLTTSHAVRAMLRMIEPALPRLSMARAPVEATFLPNNAARFADERIRFEDALKGLIGEAVRTLS